MKIALLSIALIVTVPQLFAGWMASPDHAGITYTPDQDEAGATFDAALKDLSSRDILRNLDWIDGTKLLSEATVQAEVFAILGRDAPKELKEAMASAGNMHNPKVHQLWKPFETAFLATPTVTELNASLAKYGLTISKLVCEIFTLMDTPADPERRLFGMLELHITETGGQDPPDGKRGFFYDPTSFFSHSLLPALVGFEKVRIETTLRGFFLRGDTHPGFRQDHDPSDAGIYLNVAVRDPEEIPGFSDVSKPLGTITERMVEFPAAEDEEVALRVFFTFGSHANPEACKAVDADIAALIQAWKECHAAKIRDISNAPPGR